MSTLHAMSEEQILATLISILQDVAPEADFEEIERDEDIRETLDIDSFDFLNVLIALNDETGVEIPEADYGKLVSLDDIVKYVAAKMP